MTEEVIELKNKAIAKAYKDLHNETI